MTPSRFVAVAALLLLSLASGCSRHVDRPGMGTVRIQMTDAPGSVDAVNLVITGVSIHRSDADSEGGWEVLRDDTLSLDLLTLRHGVFTTLALHPVPAGHYTQIRLKIGEGSNVVVDDVAHPLEIPSGMQSGYKLVGEYDVPAGTTLDLALDFDAERSIVLTGTGAYKLKPTVRVLPFPDAGAITGRVLPAETETSVFAILGTDTVTTTVTASDGHFGLSVLPAGSYSVAFHPAAGFRDTTLGGVNVAAGATTDVGEVQLTPQ